MDSKTMYHLVVTSAVTSIVTTLITVISFFFSLFTTHEFIVEFLYFSWLSFVVYYLIVAFNYKNFDDVK